VTHRHEAVIILILSALIGMALLSAGCTRVPLGSEPSVIVLADTTSNLAAASSMKLDNSPGILKNPDGSGSGIITLPEGNECATSDNNQSTCPLPTAPEVRNPASGTQISNPAAAYCTNMNNSLEIRKNSDGSEYGFCILADGTVCDMWDYYRGVCPLLTTPVAEARNPDAGTPGSDLAAAYCTNMNNRLEIRINPDGSNTEVCILADDTECDAIAYYEGTCPSAPAPEETPADETMINPSEAFCHEKNFAYEIRMNPDGSEHGVCIFPNGRACDAWDYYVGDCSEETALEVT
jgi:putative hemolysin